MGMERKSKRKRGGGEEKRHHRVTSSTCWRSNSVIPFGWKEREKPSRGTKRPTNRGNPLSLIFLFRFKDRSGILKGGSLKLIAYVHVSSKECAWICS